MIKRYLKLPKNKNLFLFGPRQTGKSTLIKITFSQKECIYYDLLHSETCRRFLSNPELIRGEVNAAVSIKGKSHIIIG